MAAAAAPSAEELQRALAENRARLESAAAYLAKLCARGDFDSMAEADEVHGRIDVLLDERIALRARR